VDLNRLRAETPGCRNVVHLNNAGAALQPLPVLEAVRGHLALEAKIGGYEAADRAAERLEQSYEAMARLIGASADEVAYMDSATRGWDMAFYSIPFAPGDRILTTTSEYPSNALGFLHAARRYGAVVEVIPDDEHGQISLDALSAALDQGGVRLVAINHVPTHDGLINPAAEVGRLTRAAGALYLLDACQSVGQLVVDVEEIGCDIMSGTSRKFLRGPRGTGFLYVRRDVVERLEPIMMDERAADWTGPDSFTLRPNARRFESWERSAAGQLGQAAAAEYALEVGLPAIQDRVLELAALLRRELAEIPGITVQDRGARKSAIVTFTHDGQPATSIAGWLGEQGINVRVAQQSYRYDGGAKPEHRVRASVHYYNTEDELDRMLDALRKYL